MLAVGAMKLKRKTCRRSNEGFSLVELMLAMFVLAIGVLGGMVMIIMGVSRDNSNRVDTTATNAAQAVLEEIAGAPANASPTLTLTDCLGNNLQINTQASGSPGSGAPLLANGDIDFTQGVAVGYQMNYTVCGNNGLQTVYDVRWHLTLVGPGNVGKLVVVSARQPFVANSKGIGFIAPVTLRTMVGM
jgi:prepilin-type N-terminal cleavage/methylation domain-containing protein